MPSSTTSPDGLAVSGPEGIEPGGELGRTAGRHGVDRQLRPEPGELVAAPPAHRVADHQQPVRTWARYAAAGRATSVASVVPLAAACRVSAASLDARRQALVVAARRLGQGHVDARRAGALRGVADGRERAVGLGRAVVDRRDPPAMQALAGAHVDRGGVPEALRLPHERARLGAGDLAPRHRALDAPVAGASQPGRIRPAEQGALARPGGCGRTCCRCSRRRSPDRERGATRAVTPRPR